MKALLSPLRLLLRYLFVAWIVARHVIPQPEG